MATRSAFPSVARYQTLEQLAYRDIRKAIVDGTLAPGERSVANTLAAAAGISRIPVMQALRRLESEGIARLLVEQNSALALGIADRALPNRRRAV